MKINKLQINSFGNIQNKEIELNKKINLIYGKNETGKSTIFKFIVDSLYGISKNKKGKDLSDYDRYKPWNSEEFSGKLIYTLDDGKRYEVFRDFMKKNPKLYNEQLEDISKKYTIDKTNGNQFFLEQTKIDEGTFLSTYAAFQQEVKLQKHEQNNLVQKMANILGSGDDKTSYKKAIEKINKRQVEEVGTDRTQNRPLNVLKNEKYKIQDEIGEIEQYKENSIELEEKTKKIQKDILKKEEDKKVLNELKLIIDNEKLEKEKITLNENVSNTLGKQIKELKLVKNEIEEQKKQIKLPEDTAFEEKGYKKTNNSIFVLLSVIVLVAAICLRKLIPVVFGMIIIELIIILIAIVKNIKFKKYKKQLNKEKLEIKKTIEEKKYEIEKLENEIKNINSQIDLLTKNYNLQNTEIEITIENIRNKYNNKKEELYNKYGKNIDDDNLNFEIEMNQNEINKLNIELKSIELEKNSIKEKLNKQAVLEERLEELIEQEKELIKNNEAMELAKNILEKAYIQMKQCVTPKFTQNLSESIGKISNGKYKNVRINDDGMIIEKNNGEYIPIENLSVGTIDQLYISLRFGAIKELTDETMPIILDEAFAYYDNDRLENILKYLSEEFKENQIIIFTCTNREKDILNRLNINHSFIEI